MDKDKVHIYVQKTFYFFNLNLFAVLFTQLGFSLFFLNLSQIHLFLHFNKINIYFLTFDYNQLEKCRYSI